MLHPFMPFITEELWNVTEKRSQLLALTDWPKLSTDFEDPRGFNDAGAEAEVGWLIELITAIRSTRAEMKITAEIPLVLIAVGEYTREHAENWADFIKRLARVSEIRFEDAVPQGAVQLVVRGQLAALPLKGVMLSYTDSAAAREVKGTVERRGLCGDVYVVSRPIGPTITDVTVDTSVRKGALTIGATLDGLAPDGRYNLRARITKSVSAVKEFAGPSFQGGDLKAGRFAFTEA